MNIKNRLIREEPVQKTVFELEHVIDEHTYIWRYFPKRTDEVIKSLGIFAQDPDYNLDFPEAEKISYRAIEQCIEYFRNIGE
jgi:hypothetical protein